MHDSLEWVVVVWNAASAAPSAATAWSTVAVALISALAGIGGAYLNSNRLARQESRGVRAAILAEVAALVELAERRDYLQVLRTMAVEAREFYRENPDHPEDFTLSIPLSENYNRIYLQNAQRIGVLSADEARQVVRFYQLVDSLVCDVREGGLLHDGTRDGKNFDDTADVLEAAISIAQELLSEEKQA